MDNIFQISFNSSFKKFKEEIKNSEDFSDIVIINNNIRLIETDNKNIFIWLKISYEENKIIFFPYVGTKNSIALKKQYKNRYEQITIECDNLDNIENILENNIYDFLSK